MPGRWTYATALATNESKQEGTYKTQLDIYKTLQSICVHYMRTTCTDVHCLERKGHGRRLDFDDLVT